VIPQAAIQAWSTTRPWPTLVAVEQDLVLARLIAEIARHPLLGDELVFRGGTCLHQLVLDQPLRYSEDIDFVRSTHSGIGPVIDALREVADGVGLHVAGTDIRQHPKIRLRAASETDSTAMMRIKVEINTHETSPRARSSGCRSRSRTRGSAAEPMSLRSRPLSCSRPRSERSTSAARDVISSTSGSP
jgi:hypothetical protein